MKRRTSSSNSTLLDSKLFNIQGAAVFERFLFPATKAFAFHFACGTYLVPAFQGPFPLLQHKTLMLIRPLDIALTDFQPLNDFPAVCLLERNKNTALCQN